MTKKLEIFKPGKHTAMNGQALEFTEADLAATVAAYDPNKFQAPLVVGHPAIDAPAYGWVGGLSFADGVMAAEPVQVDAAFAEMVNAGRFKKISASFYLPDAPGNPAPGSYYLKHVGFLGAQAPAVKGLKSANFSDAEEGIVEFGDWTDRVEAGLFRKLREWIIGKFGQEEADKALPGYDVDTVQNEAAQPEQTDDASASALYAENLTKQEVTMEQQEMLDKLAALDKKIGEFAEREKTLKAKEGAARHGEHVSFAEGLIKEAKLLPAQKEQAVAMLDFAAGLGEDSVIEFGEGEGKKSQGLAESFKTFLSGQPKLVEFGEIAKPEAAAATVEFAAAPGYTVDAGNLETHNKALAYQAKNPGVEYIAAIKAVQ